MGQPIEAVFENGVFRPLQPVDLPEQQRVMLWLCASENGVGVTNNDRDTEEASAIPPPPEPSPNLQSSPPQELRSLSSSVSTSLTFWNRSRRVVKVYWLNFQGQRVLYNTLPPGTSYQQQTFLTHPWVITDKEDNALELHFPEEQPHTIEIRNSRRPRRLRG